MATPRLTIAAWAFYDFALTAFSMNVISTYAALWIVSERGGTEWQYGLAKALSMALVALASPLLGALSDRLGARRPFLVGTTAAFIGLCALIGVLPSLGLGLLAFAAANVAFQLAMVFYNALLPEVAPPGRMGALSGTGKALGYIGSLAAVLLGGAFATGLLLGKPLGLPAGGAAATFGPTALLALAGALPLLLVRLPRRAPDPAAPRLAEVWPRLFRDLTASRALPGVGAYLLAAFFAFDAVNTIRDFMSLYLVKGVGLSATGGGLQSVLLVVVLASLLGALGWGQVADRLGPKPALMGVFGLLALGLVALLVAPSPALVKWAWGPVLGLAFGGVLTTSRPLLARLAPPERQGELFGAFALTNDAAAIVGPLLWGGAIALSHGAAWGYPVALGLQLALLLVGLALLARVPVPAGRG